MPLYISKVFSTKHLEKPIIIYVDKLIMAFHLDNVEEKTFNEVLHQASGQSQVLSCTEVSKR